MPQKYTQKYTVVCFFDAKNSPRQFSARDWPSHVTMLDTFKTEWTAEMLTIELKNIALATQPLSVVPAKAAWLGPKKNESVKLLRPHAGLLGLHGKLLALSDKEGFVFNSPEFVGKGFLPHATDQKSGQVAIGQAYRLADISLVDMFPQGDYMQRKTIATFGFEGNI